MIILENKALKTLYTFNSVFVLAAAMLAPLYAFFAADIGADIFTVSLLSAAFFMSRVIFTIVTRLFGDKVHEQEYLLLAGFLVRAIAWLLLIFTSSIPGLFVVQIILGLGESLGTPSFNAIFAKHLDRGHRIAEYAGWDIISMVSSALGTIAGGYVVTVYGFHTLFAAMGGLALISFFGILFKPRQLL